MNEVRKFRVNELNFKDQIHSPFPLINAVLEDKQEGLVFTLDESIPGNFYVLHKAAFSYLFMNQNSYDLNKLLHFFVTDKNLPAYFHIYDASTALKQVCEKKDEWFNCKDRTRIQLKYIQKSITVPLLPGGFQCKRIDADNIGDMNIFSLDIGKKFWNTQEDFLRNGFGFFIAKKTGQPVSICYTACVSENTAEIDVATIPEFRQKGLAKIVVAEFVNYCISNNIIANWDCFEENVSSLKTAFSLGFTTMLTYPFLSIFNKTK